MRKPFRFFLLLTACLCASSLSAQSGKLPAWALGEFIRPANQNPIILPDGESTFYCPIKQQQMKWEENDTFNPAATIKDGKICVLYRAEDTTGVGIGQRTSRIGYAESSDGINMTKRPEPVLYPAKDAAREYDSPGGCEDPRIAVTEDGLYVMFYTGNNKKNARLCVATSRDLINWDKHGLAFLKAHNGRFKDTWSKAAAIVTEIKNGRQVITRIDGKYFMYWGEFETYAATSDDLIHWTPVLDDKNELRVIAKPRKGYFDSDLVECGPPALLTSDGILLLYNGKNSTKHELADVNYPMGTYSAGQLLMDRNDPFKVIGRLDTPFFYPQEAFEKSGQYKDGTVFIEGLVFFRNKWFLYYGCADSKVGVAIYDPAATEKKESLIAGSYNLRQDNRDDDAAGNGWLVRRNAVTALIAYNDFDVFGTQEPRHNQVEDIVAALPQYAYVGVGREDGITKGEYAAIFYKKEKFRLIDSGQFWLSETPEVPSKGWGANYVRICTWACFENKEDGFRFRVFNHHADHETPMAQVEGTRLILSRIQAAGCNEPVILMGDFNADQNSPSYRTVAETGLLHDSYERAAQRYTPAGTGSDFGKPMRFKERIDHIFVSADFAVARYAILTDTYLAPIAGSDPAIYSYRFPSDHNAVKAELVYRKVSQPARSNEPVDYVNTLAGTLSTREFSAGNTYPAVAMPWGMNFWTPQTGKMGDGWTYVYTADKIRGLKQTHQPSPWIGDYGQFSIMPVTTGRIFDQDERASWFSHKAEIARPNYYSVYLADHDVTAEITPTERAVMFRLTYPQCDTAYLVVDAFDAGSYVKIIPAENKIVGYTTKNRGAVPDNFRNWFVIVSDTPFDCFSAVADGKIMDNIALTDANHAGGIVGFRTTRGQQVQLRVASSFISLEQAERNLKELGDGNFDRIVAQGRNRWNEVLGRIRIEDDNIDNLRTFYSCLYRSVLFPRDFSEIDAHGNRVHYSPFNGKVLPGHLYVDTGFWDTFRSLFPLLNLVYPDVSAKIQEGLVNTCLESGWLPEWTSPGHRNSMVGNNSASVVADAWMKGIRNHDIETLWQAMLRGANNVNPDVHSVGRLGCEYYNKLGYVPNNVGIRHNAARSLEYAYNDWCIYTLGKALGKPEKQIAIYKERAMNYRHLYNPAYKMMSGRDDKGVFDPNFDPAAWSDAFCEGNSWHWSFCVFHDPQGLINLMGGASEYDRMLDAVFATPGTEGMKSRSMIHEMREMQTMNMGQYAHGNQPIQHMVYMYNWGNQPWKSQYWARQIMNRLYNANPDGYCGDEDNGQTSAWYVFSALGFYPVCPGSDQYAIGSPLFRKVEIDLPDGKKITINAVDNKPENVYIQSMTVNKKVCDRNYVSHSELVKGATINYFMAPIPNTKRGIGAREVPYSFSGNGN